MIGNIKSILCTWMFSILVFVSCSNQDAVPHSNENGKRTGGNPVIEEGSADPSVRVFNGKVYIYPSHDFSADNDFWIMKDWKVYSTEDLIHFTDHGVILEGSDIKWAPQPDHCWAPDCIEKNGKYYFYFCLADISTGWEGQIGVAVSNSPAGPFTDPLGKPLIDKYETVQDYEDRFLFNIDPAVFIDDDGKSYLIWGNGGCYIAELNEDMISLRSEISKVEIIGHQGYREGPFVWKRKDFYYMLYSPYGGSGYDELHYATSKNIKGPYHFRGYIVGHGKKGNEHGSVFEYKGQWYVAYHDLFPTDKYRKTCFEIIHYRQNGDLAQVFPTKDGVGWYDGSSWIEAENYFEKSKGIEYREHDENGFHLSRVQQGEWVKYPNIRMGAGYENTLKVWSASGSTGGKIEIISDSLNGKKLGELQVKNTNGWLSWRTFETKLIPHDGIIDVYFKFQGDGDELLSLDWFQFQ